MENANNWYKLWNSKSLKDQSSYELKQLIELDGFDQNVSCYNESGWLVMVNDCLKRAKIKDNNDIYEIGCGAGAFLYVVNKVLKLNCHGIDYSQNHINIIKKIIPDGEFIVNEAINLPSFNKKFDFIFSHSVFQYFPSWEYASEVIRKSTDLLLKDRFLCILDINDIDLMDIYHEERSKEFSSISEYEKRINDYNHLFISKTKLRDLLLDLGYVDITFFPHAYKNYNNSKFRFNIIAKKP